MLCAHEVNGARGWQLKPRLGAFRYNVRFRGRPEITEQKEPAQAGFVAARPAGAVSTAG
jgi:hypothetical protein